MAGSRGVNRGDQPDLKVTAIGGQVRRQMQFTRGWRWREVGGADRRLSEAMANSGAFTQAALRIMRRKTGADFAFSGGGQGSATALTTDINQISTSAAPGDSVALPTAVAGYQVTIVNNGANAVDVFPASSDDLGAGANTAASLAAAANITYTSFNGTNWFATT